jgi:aminopeptidase-like protein
MILEAIEMLEWDFTPLNLSPKGEPQLGRRGLYGEIGGGKNGASTRAMLWVLNLADGTNSLIDIAERSQLAFHQIAQAAQLLVDAGLLSRNEGNP